jgi:hypothetical protein
VVQVIEALEDLGEQRLRLDGPLAAARTLLGDLENLPLGLVEQHADVPAVTGERRLGDLGGHLREAPLDRLLAHELGVAPDVQGAGRVLRERPEVGRAVGLARSSLASIDSCTVSVSAGLPASISFATCRQIRRCLSA